MWTWINYKSSVPRAYFSHPLSICHLIYIDSKLAISLFAYRTSAISTILVIMKRFANFIVFFKSRIDPDVRAFCGPCTLKLIARLSVIKPSHQVCSSALQVTLCCRALWRGSRWFKPIPTPSPSTSAASLRLVPWADPDYSAADGTSAHHRPFSAWCIPTPPLLPRPIRAPPQAAPFKRRCFSSPMWTCADKGPDRRRE